MRIRIAGEEALQAHDIRTGFRTDQDRAAGAGLDQCDASEDQGLHDPFAEFGLFDHQGTQLLRWDQERLDIVDSVNVDEGRLA
jgi:hypothetical protein